MRISPRLYAAAANERKSLKSLALSVHFHQPKLGMTQGYEILSRASAFLLSVDAKDSVERLMKSRVVGPYDHLEVAEERRKLREYKQSLGRTPATAVPGRKMMDIGWLEFVPREVRPRVHIVCSSHVLAPYQWKEYYPQDWLSVVRQEHCKYSLGVYDTDHQTEALATIEVNSQPFHHPEGRDIALLHFRDEERALETLRDLGVQTLFLRDHEKQYEKGEIVDFDGFVVGQPDAVDGTDSEYQQESSSSSPSSSNDDDEAAAADQDPRVFFNYRDTGILSFYTEDRFFATTAKPLPQGLCGAPVTDKDGDVCGTVEGVVPTGHENKQFAGSAAFIPSFVMQVFIDFVERAMVQQMMPTELFEMVKGAKNSNQIGGGIYKKDADGKFTKPTSWDAEYDKAVTRLKSSYSKEEFEKIMDVIQSQRDDVLNVFETEGGDMDQIIEKVRSKTEHLKALVQDQYRKLKQQQQQQQQGDGQASTSASGNDGR